MRKKEKVPFLIALKAYFRYSIYGIIFLVCFAIIAYYFNWSTEILAYAFMGGSLLALIIAAIKEKKDIRKHEYKQELKDFEKNDYHSKADVHGARRWY